MEIWKDVQGYEGLYQVSNLGRVKSLPKYHYKRERILKPTDNGNGYKIVGIRENGRRLNFYVHRLVATAFVPNPKRLGYVNHKDYNKDNNMASNLEWCTQKENVNYSIERMKKPRQVTYSSTGHKYIYFRNGKYRVCVPNKIEKRFNTLEMALHYREVVLNER